MIAHLLILAAAVLPPQGPLRWKGEEIKLNPPARYFRIVPMKEPEPVKEVASARFSTCRRTRLGRGGTSSGRVTRSTTGCSVIVSMACANIRSFLT